MGCRFFKDGVFVCVQMDNVTSALMMRSLLGELQNNEQQRFHCLSALGMVTHQTGLRSGALDLELCTLCSVSHLHVHSKEVLNRLGYTVVWWNLNCAFCVQCLMCMLNAKRVFLFVGQSCM